MNRRLLSALAAGTLLASGAAALAQAPAAPPPRPAGHSFFDEVDSNKDGVVTRAEVTASLDKRFAELDTDKNGTITQAERQAHRDAAREKRINERFAALDTDKNGQLSPAEFRTRMDRRDGSDKDAGAPPPRGPGFDKGGHGFGRDRGFDGPRFGGGRGRGDWGKGPGGPDGQGPGGNGDVTKDAFSKRALAMFDRLDSNDDGKISAAERDAARAGHRGFTGHGGPRGEKPGAETPAAAKPKA